MFEIKEQELKTKLLEFERRIAEIGLEVEKLKRDFSDVWGIVPQLKGRLEDLETNTDVIILGSSDLKDQLNGLSEELSSFKKNFMESVDEFNNRIQNLKADLNRSLALIENLKLSNESAVKSLEENLEKDIRVLREIVDKSMAQVDLLYKNIESVNSNVKALQKVVEMSDNTSLMKQIDALNVKIVNLNVMIEQLKNSIPDTSGLSKDIGILNSKIQNLQMNLMDIKNDLAEKEKRLTLNEIELEKIKTSTKNSIDSVFEKIKEQDEKFIKAKNLDVLANFGLESKKRMKEIESARIEIQSIYKAVQKINYEINKKMYDLAYLKNEFENVKNDLNKIKFLMEKSKKPEIDVSRSLEELKSKFSLPDKTLLELLERIKIIEERLSILEMSNKVDVPAVIE